MQIIRDVYYGHLLNPQDQVINGSFINAVLLIFELFPKHCLIRET